MPGWRVRMTAPHDTARELREARDRFALLFDTAPVAMVVGSLQDGCLREVNAAFEQLTGWTRAGVIGRTSADFGLWADEGFREATHARLRADGEVPPCETRLRRADGHLLDVRFSACRVEIGGIPHFIAMVADDTAARERHARAIADLYDNAP